MSVQESYTIQLEHFEGPFDLLLFFINRDEIDIHDIPIAKITQDFLAYMRQMQMLNMELASEFIVVAASLMRIKAKMLLPRQPLNADGEEVDPREELVNRLLEYRRFKEVIDDLRALEDRRSRLFTRGNLSYELQRQANAAFVDIELENLTLYNLYRAFQQVLDRANRPKRKVHTIVRYNYTIRSQQKRIFHMLDKDSTLKFDLLFEHVENRVHAIVHFLALLELANQYIIQVFAMEEINQFYIRPGEAYENRWQLLHRAEDEEE